MLATTIRSAVVVLCCVLGTALPHFSTDLIGQENQPGNEFTGQLVAGEFSSALESARSQADPETRDRMLEQIARAQRGSDTGLNAFSTAALIEGDARRFGTFGDLTDLNGSNSNDRGFDNGGGQNGNGGGITAADFDELIDLLQETIDTDSWEANGGNGRIRAFPSGVFVDSNGTMKLVERDTTGRLNEIRDVATDLDNASLLKKTELRKVSLSRLERELQYRAASGQPVSSDMKHLAGIYKLQYVILYPETNDVVIAGPAGPWHYDATGRAINDETGQPVLNLDDLVVCLRNARQNGGQFSCSIDPRQENLTAAKAFTETTTLKGKVLRTKLKEILGQMDVTVDGIDPTTHAARVVVEADYLMKLVGLGVESGVSGLKDYFERIHLDDTGKLPPTDQLVRWWFTMNYDSIATNIDRTIFELNGQGVKLLSESEFWDEMGERVHTGKSSAAASGFASDFTARFQDLASEHPVFGELKNLFDCAIAANVIRNEGLARKIDWKLNFLDGNTRPGTLTYQLASELVPGRVDSILGQRVLTHRQGRSSTTYTISGFGGGVVFNSAEHAAPGSIEVITADTLNSSRNSSAPETESRRDWSWD